MRVTSQPELVRPRLSYPDIPYGAMLDRPVMLYPDRTAVVFNDTSVTFRELDGLVNAFANALRGLGIGRGDRVALYMTNRPEYVVSFFALARIGAVSSPMNPSYREREVAYQLGDSESVAVVVQHDLAAAVRAVRGELPRLKHVITVGPGTPVESDTIRFPDLIAGAPPAPPPVELHGDDLLTLPYSSGTTGMPKGVLLSHRNFVANNLQFIASSRVTEDDRFLIFLPLYHIYGLMLMGGAVHAGVRTVLMERFDPNECLRLTQAEKITIVFAVPPVLVLFCQRTDLAQVDWSSVRHVMIGAAPVPPEVSRRFTEITGVKVVQGYGLTEASPITHLNPVYDDALLTIDTTGLPCNDTEQKVVDLETGERELGPNEVGEVIIRGPQVMLGYWNAPEATAATVRNGWLYTGDIGRIDERGYLTITDRKKEMIKYKGFGIAPAEIEALLFEHPGVADGAVIGKPDLEAGEVPKAFVVRKDPTLTAEALLEWARGRLAGYKTLHEVEFVDAIPKTASGKILRRVLKEQERKRVGLG
ncbi:MAG: long-chain-fatty-acid--CoA ligase [Candidatus Rokubacteria bacterium]|nr:long-chain-fatty-acid--CoA ligase [Candidatus Rokubacteria bacterium]